MGSQMGLASLYINITEPHIKVNLKTDQESEKLKKFMNVALYIMVLMLTDNSWKVPSHIIMNLGIYIEGKCIKGIDTAKELCTIMMSMKGMKVNGIRMKNKDKGVIISKMEINLMDNGLMEKEMVEVSTNLLMAINLLVNTKMINAMVQVNN